MRTSSNLLSPRSRALLVGLALCAAAMLAPAQQFPTQPTDPEQCGPISWLSTAEGERALAERRQELNSDKNNLQCDRRFEAPSKPWRECMAEGMRRGEADRQRWEALKQHNEAQYRQNRAGCRAVAEQNRETLRRQAEQKRQQEQLARDNERRTREAYAENQKKQYAQELEAKRREVEREKERQRVIAQTPPSAFDPATRNTPRVVMTPEMAAQARAQEQAQRAQERREESQALADTFRRIGDSMDRSRASGAASVGATGAGMAETNAAVTVGRGGSPVAGAIGGASIAATGAKTADALNQLQGATTQMQSIATGATGATGGSSTATSAGPAPVAMPEPPRIALPRRDGSVAADLATESLNKAAGKAPSAAQLQRDEENRRARAEARAQSAEWAGATQALSGAAQAARGSADGKSAALNSLASNAGAMDSGASGTDSTSPMPEYADSGTRNVPYDECVRQENASGLAASMNALPSDNTKLLTRGAAAASGYLVALYRQCLPDPRAQQMIDSYQRRRDDSLRTCRKIGTTTDDCAQPPFAMPSLPGGR